MSLLNPQLEAFMAVAEEKTVQGAAHQIGLTQTAVTQRLRALESQLGASMFLRSRTGMKITREGEALLHYCQTVRDLAGETLARIRGEHSQTTVRVGITGPTSFMRSRVISPCAELKKKHPNLIFHYDLADDGSGVAKLKRGEFDFAILPKEEVTLEMDSKLLKPQAYILIGPAKWKKRKLKDIVQKEWIVDFNPNDDLTFRYLRHFGLLGKAKRERHFANNTDALAQLVCQGYGYSVLPKLFAKELLRKRDLIELHPGKTYEYFIALAWYPRAQMPLYFRDIVKTIK